MYRGPRFIGKYFIFVLVGASPVLWSLSLFIHSLFLFFFRLSPRLAGRARTGLDFIYLFLCSRQRRSPVSPVWIPALEQQAGLGRLRAGRRGRGLEGRGLAAGRGLPAERHGLARTRLAVSSRACGSRSGGQIRMPAGSVRLQLHFSPARRQLAPAGEGDAAALYPRTLVSQPRAPPEKAKCSQVQPVSRAVPERTPPDSTSRGASTSEPFLERSAPGARGRGIHGGERGDRAPRMGRPTWRVGCCCLLLLALVVFTRSEGMQSCEEVRKLFQWRLVGAVKGLPDSPRPGKAVLAGAAPCAWARAGAP